MIRAVALTGLAVACIGCAKTPTRDSTLKVSYYAQDSAFSSAEPLRVSVGEGKNLRSLRGVELQSYHPFLISGPMPLDSGATLPVAVLILGAIDDTLAQAQLTLGPVAPATVYTVGVSAGGRNPATAPSGCGAQVAVPLRRLTGDRTGDSLFVSISGVRDGVPC